MEVVPRPLCSLEVSVEVSASSIRDPLAVVVVREVTLAHWTRFERSSAQ
jgi:hypothetical protein